MQRVGTILKKFVGDYGLETGLSLVKIKKQWTKLVGQTLASHTFPDIIKGKTIFITVDTPQWMHHVSFHGHEIAEKLKSYNIEKVRFKLGKICANPGCESARSDIYKLSDEDTRYIEDTVKGIKSDELKEKFRLLLTHALGHKKRTKGTISKS
ncbi:MAG: DUF721 domain-containing protein [Thermodesulfovibrionia bacterium]|nr:DUF721 domain-containing protein [Thermodesulfovibrionia bacterium]